MASSNTSKAGGLGTAGRVGPPAACHAPVNGRSMRAARSGMHLPGACGPPWNASVAASCAACEAKWLKPRYAISHGEPAAGCLRVPLSPHDRGWAAPAGMLGATAAQRQASPDATRLPVAEHQDAADFSRPSFTQQCVQEGSMSFRGLQRHGTSACGAQLAALQQCLQALQAAHVLHE